MALSDSLAVERVSIPGPKCGIVKVRAQLDSDDASALDAALVDETITNAALSRALFREGYRVNDQTISRHRNGKCGCGVR